MVSAHERDRYQSASTPEVRQHDAEGHTDERQQNLGELKPKKALLRVCGIDVGDAIEGGHIAVGQDRIGGMHAGAAVHLSHRNSLTDTPPGRPCHTARTPARMGPWRISKA